MSNAIGEAINSFSGPAAADGDVRERNKSICRALRQLSANSRVKRHLRVTRAGGSVGVRPLAICGGGNASG
jgi:hypothetical protein